MRIAIAILIVAAHPVQPSDTWSRKVTIPNQFGPEAISYRADSRFLSYVSQAGHTAAEVQTEATIPVDLAVDLRRAGQATGRPPAPQLPNSASFQGREHVRITTLLDVNRHRIDRTDSVADLHLSEVPLGPPAAASVRSPSFSGTEAIAFQGYD